jgi:hypothetical protein
MIAEVTSLLPLFTVLSSCVSVLSLAIAFVAFRRTSRFQDVDYQPHVVASCDDPSGCIETDRDDDDSEEEMNARRNLEVEFAGKITNAGPRPVYISSGRIMLGPRHRDDPEEALTVPFFKTLGTGHECTYKFTLMWATIWDVADQFKKSSIECHLMLTLRGADGVDREVRRFLGTLMQAEGKEWIAIAPHYFLEVLNGIQQARLRRKINPTRIRSGGSPLDPDVPF